jgi:hypothetical protein
VVITLRADRKRFEISDGVAALLFLQMPMVYAVERGNIDALVIPIYAAAIAFFASRRFFASGVLLAAACWMKVYPTVPAVILVCAILFGRDLRREIAASFLKGFFVGGLGLGLIFLPDSYRYVFRVLPELAAQPGGFGTSSHTLFRGLPGLFFKVPVLGLWIFFTRKALRRDPVFILAAGLAISTFFQNLSNDYNLITAFPFLFLLARRLLREGISALDFGMLLLTFWAFVGDRTPIEIFFPNRSALFLQAVWFVSFPVFYLGFLKNNPGAFNPRLESTSPMT